MINGLVGLAPRLWLMALCGVLSVAAGSAVAQIPPAPLGLDRDGTTYDLLSNNRWHVSENGGGFVLARAVIPIHTANPNATDAFNRQDYAYIWAGRCTASRQALVFRRDYYLPGPPKLFEAYFDNSSFAGLPSNQAISQTSLVINGKVALTVNGGKWTVPRGARYTRLFKYGANTVEFRVTKRVRQGTTLGQCQHGSPARPLGITFNLRGEFETDLWLSNDPNVTPVIVEKRDPGNPGLEVFIRPRNFGPSGAYKGGLQITFSSTNAPSALVQNSVRVTGGGVRNCTVQSFTQPIRINCEVYRFQVGATPVVRFIATIQLAPGYSQAYALAGASIFSSTRDVISNNSWSRERIYCGPTATEPEVPAAVASVCLLPEARAAAAK